MRASVRRAVLVNVLLALYISFAYGTTAQDAGTDAETAGAQAVHLSQLAASGALSELYALMHPDAQALTPEPVFVSSYNRRIGPLNPGVLTVTNVTFGDWTWSVTGVSYANVAMVSFTQPLWDGSVLNGSMRLVQDEDEQGTWRWFFGRSREHIDTEIARAARASERAAEIPDPAPALSPTEPPEPIAAPRPTRTPAPTPEVAIGTTPDNPAPFSQLLAGGGARVQLLDGYFAEELEFDTPKRGYKYLVLEVRIKGTEEDGHLYSSTNFSGEDAKTGAGYDSEFFISVDVLGSDTLSRGEYVIGTVVLEVQETARQIIVKYDPNQITLDDLYWRFP